jgi:hypothetical protein
LGGASTFTDAGGGHISPGAKLDLAVGTAVLLYMIMRMVVDLPAPFGPRNPVTVPGAIVKLRECTAVVSP